MAEFAGGEPEQAIAPQRPAERRRHLLPIEWRGLVLVVERRRQRLPAIVSRKDGRRALRRVGARARDDVDDRRGRAAEVGAEAVGRDLKLLHGIDRQVQQRSADHVVVVVLAVDGDVAAASHLPGGGDQHAVGLRRIEDRCGRVAGHEQRQLEEVPAVERQRLDTRTRQDPVNHRADRTRVAAHDHALLDIPDIELDVELPVLPDLQRDRLGSPGHEAAQRQPRRRTHPEAASETRSGRGRRSRPSRSWMSRAIAR